MRHEQTSERHRLDTICLIGIRTALPAMEISGAGVYAKVDASYRTMLTNIAPERKGYRGC